MPAELERPGAPALLTHPSGQHGQGVRGTPSPPPAISCTHNPPPAGPRPQVDLGLAGRLRKVAQCGTRQQPLHCTLSDQNPVTSARPTSTRLCKTHLVPNGGSLRPVPMPFQNDSVHPPWQVPLHLPRCLSQPQAISLCGPSSPAGFPGYPRTPPVGTPAPCSPKCGPQTRDTSITQELAGI